MKNIIQKNTLFLVLAVVCLFGIYKVYKNYSKEKLPIFQLTGTDEKPTFIKWAEGKYHLIIFFDSLCDHCQDEAKEIRDNISFFKNVEISFISTEKMRNIRAFSNEYEFKKFENVNFYQVEPDVLMKEFGPMGYPTIFIYNTDKQLVKKFSGKVPLQELQKLIK